MSSETQVHSPTEQKDQKNEVIETNLAKQRQMYERKLEQERIEKQQLAERIAALEASVKERSKKVEYDDETDDDNEPYVDRRKLHKELSRFQKNMEQTIDQKAEAKAAALLEQERIRNYMNQNPDFNKVLSDQDLLERFAQKDPELAESILQMPDTFERKKLVYRNIKSLGLDKPEVKQPSVQEKIDANRRSPYYQPSGVGTAPYAPTGDFSPSGQKSAFAKMKELQSRLRM